MSGGAQRSNTRSFLTSETSPSPIGPPHISDLRSSGHHCQKSSMSCVATVRESGLESAFAPATPSPVQRASNGLWTLAVPL